MKRVWTILLAGMLLLGGCSANTGSGKTNTPDTPKGGITLNDTTLFIGGRLTEEKKEALGEPVSTSEAPSCMYEGVDIIYEYDAFSLQVNQQGEDEILCIVTIQDPTYATDKGVEIGDTLQTVKRACGDPVAETKYYIEYAHTSTVNLTLYLEEERVTYMEYTIAE